MKFDPFLNAETAQAGMTGMAGMASWAGMCRVAGVSVFIAVALMLLDFALSFTGGDVPTGAYSVLDWFAQFQSSPFLGLRNLGLFNVINPILTLPLYLVLVQLHRRHSPSSAALALVLMLLGIAVYCANNRALAMLSLSGQYSAAVSEAQRSLLAAAGTLILAQAEDFTPGSFAGFFLQSFASLLMLVLMLRGGLFNRWIAWIGLVGGVCLLVFTVSVTFVPATFDLAMLLALVGGLLMLAWNVSMALSMLRLGRGAARQAGRAADLEALDPFEKASAKAA